MEFNLIILGSLLILTFFSVGESVLKFYGIKKNTVLFSLALITSGLFLPTVNILGYTFHLGYVLFPLTLSILAFFKIKSFSKFLICFLISIFSAILFSLLKIENNALIVVAVFSLVIAIIQSLLHKNIFLAFSSVFLGMSIGYIISHYNKFEQISFFGNEQIFSIILLSMISFSLISFAFSKLSRKQKVAIKA